MIIPPTHTHEDFRMEIKVRHLGEERPKKELAEPNTVSRRNYPCILGEHLLYRDSDADYYHIAKGFEAYKYNPRVIGCASCRYQNRCRMGKD